MPIQIGRSESICISFTDLPEKVLVFKLSEGKSKGSDLMGDVHDCFQLHLMLTLPFFPSRKDQSSSRDVHLAKEYAHYAAFSYTLHRMMCNEWLMTHYSLALSNDPGVNVVKQVGCSFRALSL